MTILVEAVRKMPKKPKTKNPKQKHLKRENSTSSISEEDYI